MNRPNVFVRVAGSPLPALALFVGYAAIVVGWYQNNVPWWLALGAVGAALRTLSALGQVRRYKAWAAEWNAMGAPLRTPPPSPKRASRGWVFITGAVLLLLTIPPFMLQIRSNNEQLATALLWLWGAVCLYLVWKCFGQVLRAFMRSRTRSKVRRQAKEEASPVEWLVGQASSSPSREEAQRKLPEYAAACLGLGVQQEGVRRMTA
jgi:hypothetical protein